MTYKVFGSHFAKCRIIDTTTEAGKNRVQSSLEKVFRDTKVLEAMTVLNTMQRRVVPCPKPAKHRLVTGTKTGPIKRGAAHMDIPTANSEEPFFSNNRAYLATVSPEQTQRLRNGQITTIERPYSEFWKARLNAQNKNGMPKIAAVMMMTPGEPSVRSEEYAVTSCMLIGSNLQFTLDPSATCDESDGQESPSSRGNAIAPHDPEPKKRDKS